MSLHPSDFDKKDATPVGGLVGRSCSVHDFFRFPAGEFVNRVPVDPACHPADLRVAVRASVRTEQKLAAIARKLGFEFWGEAVALVIGYAAAFPEEFDSRGLDTGLGRRMVSGQGFSKAGGGNSVGGILAPMTRDSSDFLSAVASRHRTSRKIAATLILQRHVARIADLLGA